MKISFELAGGAKESHNRPIYCVAWSKDLHEVKEEDSTVDVNNGDGGGGSKIGDKKVDNDGTTTDGGNVDKDLPIRTTTTTTTTTTNYSGVTTYCRYMATCGSNHLTLYEVFEKSKGSKSHNNSLGKKAGFRARQVYIDADDEEIFYSCLFVGQGVGTSHGYGPRDGSGSHSNSNSNSSGCANAIKNTTYQVSNLALNDGPQLCCVAGTRGIIKVIDTVRTTLLLTLSGHGNEIYDMSVSPHNPWLLISASKDESLRLWNVQNAQCIAIFAGHYGHRDAVLSVDWHPLGKAFVSSGMDETIKIWSLEGDQVRRAMETDKRQDGTFRTAYEQLPIFSTAMIHVNYVDCVKFVGDLILSKSTTNTIALWKPELSLSKATNQEYTATKLPPSKCKDKFLHLCDFDIIECDVWYVRFGTNSSSNMLAIGNGIGNVRLYHIDSRKYYKLVNYHCSALIRHVSFSPDDKSIIAVCDDSTIWKWDIEY